MEDPVEGCVTMPAESTHCVAEGAVNGTTTFFVFAPPFPFPVTLVTISVSVLDSVYDWNPGLMTPNSSTPRATVELKVTMPLCSRWENSPKFGYCLYSPSYSRRRISGFASD